jgi:hypothetical protein
LNKKWFLKIDRRPTQANPGKGCYWTLVAGKEHIFITNLTQEGGYNRKHHDIGLTTELSLGQRRGVCFYHSAGPNEQQPLDVKVTTAMTLNNNALEHQYGLSTPPLTPTKPELSRPLLSPLYTTFRMVSENAPTSPNKKRSRRKLANAFTTDESEYDSGVDLSSECFEGDHFQKRHRASSPFQESLEACDAPLSGTFLTESPSSDWKYSSDPCTAKSQDMLTFPQVHWSWPDSAQLAYFAKHPGSIDLENNPLSQKYLPFREDSALIQSYYSPYTLYPPHPNPFVSMQDILYS